MTGSKLAAQIAIEEKREAEAMRKHERSQEYKKERTSAEAQSCTQLDYSTYLQSKAITKETRLKSYIDRPVARKEIILEALGDQELTAREVKDKLGYEDFNAVRPRLHELMEEGRVEVVGMAYDAKSKKDVSVFRRCDQ